MLARAGGQGQDDWLNGILRKIRCVALMYRFIGHGATLSISESWPQGRKPRISSLLMTRFPNQYEAPPIQGSRSSSKRNIFSSGLLFYPCRMLRESKNQATDRIGCWCEK